MRTVKIYTTLLLLACMQGVWADEPAGPPKTPAQPPHTAEMVLLMEGLAVFNSGLASADPEVTGGIILLTSPLALAESGGHASDWTGFGAYVAIGAYDAGAYGPGYSRGRVFVENFVAWNLLYAATLAAEHFDPKAAPAEHLSIVAVPRDGVRVDYRWTF